MDIRKLLEAMPRSMASDLHIRVGIPPIYRIQGALTRASKTPVTAEDMLEMLKKILTSQQIARFNEEMELDFALQIGKESRFRVNLYRQKGTPALAFRLINTSIPRFDSLNLPPILEKLSQRKRGMILVTGITGSGKSTTLASMVDYINRNSSMNIITVEDPIEYIHDNKRSIIAQREIGQDTLSFSEALRRALRQDPDVIQIGEIRDEITMQIALSAADTGHLVLSTLHTLDSLQTIYRILSFFPPHQHQEIRLLISSTLQAVVSQRLIPRDDKPGRVPACEILIGTEAVKEFVTDPEKTSGIRDLISEGAVQYGMQSFDQSLMSFYKQGMISLETALENATNPDDFKLRIQGFVAGSDRGWQEFEMKNKKEQEDEEDESEEKQTSFDDIELDDLIDEEEDS
ncbi:MAG: type IV pilus twitching motility protein PilT [Candidatus Zixiibacteriota bacterium]